MIITVDCNSDELIITDNKNPMAVFKLIKSPTQLIKILEEIFNRLNPIETINTLQIQLDKIEEDNRNTVGEW